MEKNADAVVIGGGIMGASTAHFLAKRGFGKVVLLEKQHLAAQRHVDALSTALAATERQRDANSAHVLDMQRKFATGSQGTLMLKKNAGLQRRLAAVEEEKAQLAGALQQRDEEDASRAAYISHLRKALDMKASEFGLHAGQSGLLEELVRLRANYRASLQEVAL